MVLLVVLMLIFVAHTHIVLVPLVATPVHHHIVALEMVLVEHVVREVGRGLGHWRARG